MTTATCRVCAGPLTAVSDDPDLSHPSCAPADPQAFEAATSGPRVYGHGTPLAWWFTCGCGQRVEAGVFVEMRDTADGRRWVCPDCCRDAPETAPDRPESDEPALSRLPVTPAGRSERSGDDTDAPRRAVA